jgi:predicted aminopeptidase
MGMSTIRRWREEQANTGERKPSEQDKKNNEMLEPILKDGETVKESKESSFSMENKKDELTAELDRLNVKYDSKANKEELLALIEENQK